MFTWVASSFPHLTNYTEPTEEPTLVVFMWCSCLMLYYHVMSTLDSSIEIPRFGSVIGVSKHGCWLISFAVATICLLCWSFLNLASHLYKLAKGVWGTYSNCLLHWHSMLYDARERWIHDVLRSPYTLCSMYKGASKRYGEQSIRIATITQVCSQPLSPLFEGSDAISTINPKPNRANVTSQQQAAAKILQLQLIKLQHTLYRTSQ